MCNAIVGKKETNKMMILLTLKQSKNGENFEEAKGSLFN